MDEGFTIDDTYGALVQAAWAEGKPKRSVWTGISVKKDERHPITTFRCSRCGFLESFADLT